MAFEMVDGDQRLVEGEGQRLGVADADQQCSGEAGALGDGDGVDGFVGVLGLGQRLAHHRHDGAQMLARSQFRDDSAVRLVSRDLRGHDIRDQLLARAHHGRCGLVAGTFDAEDVGVRHLCLFQFIVFCLTAPLWRFCFAVGSIMESRSLLTVMLKDFATSIVQTLRQRGFQAYLVGGCVRDLLLGREPKDYDVATDATPEQVMDIFPETYAVGAQFGVVLVPAPERDVASNVSTDSSSKSYAVEVATFRSDIGYSDGRHPDEVRFSRDPREDVARRDFTINGMLLDPVSGEVLDFVGGRKDLEAGIIRTIGDPRAALRGRQAAHAAGGALCRAVRIRD